MKKLFMIIGGSEKERYQAASDIRKEARKKGLDAWSSDLWTAEIERMLGEFSQKLPESNTRTELTYLLLKAKAETDGTDWFAKKLISKVKDAISYDVLTVADVTDKHQIDMIRKEGEKEGVLVFVVQTPSIPYGYEVKPDFRIVPGFTIPVIMNAICKKEVA